MPYAIAAIVLAAWAFWPKYDLQIATDPQLNHYSIVEQDIYGLAACRDAAGNYRGRAYDWICLKHSNWSAWTNDYSKYDSKHR